jgi:hypothetical protein
MPLGGESWDFCLSFFGWLLFDTGSC